MNPELTPDQQKLLSAYRATGLISIAAPLAGVPPTLHEDSLQTSETYREAFASAQRDSALSLEEQARHRALVGTETPVYHAGEVVGSRQHRSDRLLIALLQANAPGKFY
ncbi:hypothetical protein [Planctomyces sp. SH-PL14]|uniref:hypothetical protein n=1 Tax=Planctomyces sp. SH-PL14 TaxID=1632864 RepID=UPI00078CACCA|nr:hypothetical protein [Planctomyces sp. SH-PL14]AMV18564.1 hypothetical protein VT03_11775 [Planctomyces sp. SH-PL14]